MHVLYAVDQEAGVGALISLKGIFSRCPHELSQREPCFIKLTKTLIAGASVSGLVLRAVVFRQEIYVEMRVFT